MGNSLRCCIACVLPCGALDLVRVVHLNGYVEEITRPITAAEFLKSYPNHVLSLPCSQGVARRILILSPDSELKRGCIYFLIPSSSLPPDSNNKNRKKRDDKSGNKQSSSSCNLQDNRSSNNKIRRSVNDTSPPEPDTGAVSGSGSYGQHQVRETGDIGKRCLQGRDRRHHSRTASWLPHLESIAED
ncbi:uncharacterized protein LOC116211767 [Punica granatum]|uniref:DUF4228 domain-containing protein n=2 Tax=Punica granatum TaxID=22663 RepID=A0A218W750_PUNGR|nr:uncharacterized protein LOC116211767 [Punica granatum]OWM68707.1 hypothetical protein CDL15_Pgr024894 [Punica granatum]PKI58457.1 hypothetical protein CRG98_021142 [Punica granatum]